MIFIDTHVLVWLYDGRRSLFSDRAWQLMQAHSLRLSPMVLLELQYLYEIGRIKVEPDKIMASLKASLNLSVDHSDFERVVAHAQGESWTRDPFDRLIVAQTKLYETSLITKDHHIHAHFPLAVW